LYRSETFSVILKEEYRVLRRIFGPIWEEEIGHQGKVHNEELYNLYPSPNIIRIMKSKRMRWVRHLAYIQILVGKPDGKTQVNVLCRGRILVFQRILLPLSLG
jgi:hypothetical protein